MTIFTGDPENARRTLLRSGDTEHVPGGTPHTFRNFSEVAARLLVTFCPGEMMEKFFVSAGHRVTDPCSLPVLDLEAEVPRVFEVGQAPRHADALTAAITPPTRARHLTRPRSARAERPFSPRLLLLGSPRGPRRLRPSSGSDRPPVPLSFAYGIRRRTGSVLSIVGQPVVLTDTSCRSVSETVRASRAGPGAGTDREPRR